MHLLAFFLSSVLIVILPRTDLFAFTILLPFLFISLLAISKTFCLDLLIDPKTRGVNDLAHQITAVGSRTVEKATQFIEDNGLGKQAKWFGSYEEVYSSPVRRCEANEEEKEKEEG